MRSRSSGKAEDVQSVRISRKFDSEKRWLFVLLHVSWLRVVFTTVSA
jgi:hypothetical protein